MNLGVNPGWVTWSPDSDRLLVTVADQGPTTFTVRNTGARGRLLATSPAPPLGGHVTLGRPLPTGPEIVLTSAADPTSAAHQPARTRALAALGKVLAMEQHPAWLADHTVISADGSTWPPSLRAVSGSSGWPASRSARCRWPTR